MLDDLINSFKDSLHTESLAMLRQINMSSNDIPSLRDRASDLKRKRDLLRNGSQGY